MKRDLVDYMKDSKFEYKNPTQPYDEKHIIEEKWDENNLEINDLNKMLIHFYIKKSNVTPPRYYITHQSNSKEIWTLFRSIMLPTISHMTIFKLKNVDTKEIIFYFKPYLDYSYNAVHHKSITTTEIHKIEESDLKPTMKESLIKSRLGQGKFRENLLKEWGSCIITKIDEQRILIASHIKPWAQSTNIERLDRYNGLILSSTIDRLFDQGFITFKKDGALKISDHISIKNTERLGIEDDKCYKIPHLEDRIPYLEYHQKHVFRK